MANAALPPAGPEKLSWKYPPTFWFANGAELFERAAFYGMFITIFRYLTIAVGFSDVEAGWITGTFAASLYSLPTFMGIMADKIGFKQALTLAFALLTIGYGLLGAYQAKTTAVIALGVIVVGGAIIKPVISGTVAKCSDSVNRARAMSIFYMVVNIGSFLGKSIAAPLNERFGLDKINFYAAAMAFCALILVVSFYRNPDAAGTGKTVRQALLGLVKVLGNVRFGVMILIIGGFWAIQGQLYASMPSYIERLLGVGYKPEWLANINPLVVVLLVVPITHLVRNFKPASAIGIGLAVIPFTALVVALGPVVTKLTGESINLWITTMHPLVLVFIVGIALQGVAECFLSPKWLEFASKQAPPGEVGLYLGYSHLTTFFAWLFGFVLAGYLLAGYCPDPKTLRPEVRHDWRLATDPGYRFALDNQLFGEVAAGTPVSAALQAAFARHDLELPPEVQLEEDRPEGRWAVKTTDTWRIKLDGKTRYQIKRVSYNVNDLPRDLVAQLEAENHPKVQIEPAEGRQRAKLVEYVVISAKQRPRAEMPPVPAVYERAHYLWYAFTLVGIVAFLALLVFKYVTNAFDTRAAQAKE